jgi:hypothetical protein
MDKPSVIEYIPEGSQNKPDNQQKAETEIQELPIICV